MIAEKLVRDDLLVVGDAFGTGLFARELSLIFLKARLGMHFRLGSYPGLIKMSGRDDFQRGN